MKYQVLFLENDEWKPIDGAIFDSELEADRYAEKHERDFCQFTDVEEVE